MVLAHFTFGLDRICSSGNGLGTLSIPPAHGLTISVMVVDILLILGAPAEDIEQQAALPGLGA